MKQLITLIGLVAITACTGIVGIAPKAVAQEQVANSLFWEISGNGLAAPSYLYGTVHLLCKDDINVSQAMQDAMGQSNRLVLELDMDEKGFVRKSQKLARMSKGTTLEDVLSASDYQLVKRYFKDSLHLPISLFKRWQPMMVSSLVMVKVLGCAPTGYEQVLMELAKDQQKEVLGLETVEEQMEALSHISYEEQAEMLVEMINNYGETQQMIGEMMTLYRNEDLQGLRAMISDYTYGSTPTDEATQAFEERLLKERNQAWIPQIEKLAEEQPTFFAVGAGHLSGHMGVIQLLRQAGYTVRPVTN